MITSKYRPVLFNALKIQVPVTHKSTVTASEVTQSCSWSQRSATWLETCSVYPALNTATRVGTFFLIQLRRRPDVTLIEILLTRSGMIKEMESRALLHHQETCSSRSSRHCLITDALIRRRRSTHAAQGPVRSLLLSAVSLGCPASTSSRSHVGVYRSSRRNVSHSPSLARLYQPRRPAALAVHRVDECDCEPGYILHWLHAGLWITVKSIAPASTAVTASHCLLVLTGLGIRKVDFFDRPFISYTDNVSSPDIAT